MGRILRARRRNLNQRLAAPCVSFGGVACRANSDKQPPGERRLRCLHAVAFFPAAVLLPTLCRVGAPAYTWPRSLRAQTQVVSCLVSSS